MAINFFELYGIPESMKLDSDKVKKAFYALSRQYHPDFFTNADQESQAEALEKSSMLNKAYKIFQNPDETIRYVLQLHNLVEEEEKYQLNPAFLMEVMEINEQLMEIGMEANDQALTDCMKQTEELLKRIYEDVRPIVEHYSKEVTTEAELQLVKDYYYRKKYLQRILDKIGQMRNIASP